MCSTDKYKACNTRVFLYFVNSLWSDDFFGENLLAIYRKLSKTPMCCPKSPKMQHPKMAFIRQIESSIKGYDAISILCFELFSDETQNWLMDFWIPQRVLMHDIRMKYSGKLLTISYWKWSRSHNFYPKFSKMQLLKMNIRSQIEPSVKRYESFMFIVFAEFQIGNHHKMMDSWKPSIIFFFNPRNSKIALYHQNKPN